MSDWEEELNEIEEKEQKTTKEETKANNNDELDDWEKDLDKADISTTKKQPNKDDEETEEIFREKQKVVVAKQEPKENQDEYEEKWISQNKEKLEREAAYLKALEGLDEKTKTEKIQELKRLMDAEELVDDSANAKFLNFDYKDHKLEVEKDFTNLAVNVVAKIKAMNNPKFALSFLKKINLAVSKNFEVEMINDLLQNFKLILNKKKSIEKRDDKKPKKSANEKVTVKAAKKMNFDGVTENTEINPDYKPRNQEIYDDFM